MRVSVYRNLHKKCYSVVCMEPGPQRGRVIHHCADIDLQDARFVVQPAGWQKVRAGGPKNVHAFVRGDWYGVLNPDIDTRLKVSYNPRNPDRGPYFYVQGKPALGAGFVRLAPEGVTASYVEFKQEKEGDFLPF